MDRVTIAGKSFDGVLMPTEHSVVIIVRGARGMLACGYLSVDTANRLGDALVLVRGVRSYDDVQQAVVREVSHKARELGVEDGMTGAQALAILA